jgi:signal recognition particle receptor subunit beta
MGFNNWLKRLRGRNDRRVLVLGLEGAGKTAVVDRLLRGAAGATTEDAPAASTSTASSSSAAAAEPPRFTVRSGRVGRHAWAFWEVGGGDTLRPYWRHYYAGTQGVLFVVDADRADDAAAVATAASELAALGGDDQLAGVPVAVLLNSRGAASASAAGGGGSEAHSLPSLGPSLEARLGLKEALGGGGGGSDSSSGPGRPWVAITCSSTTGEGLDRALGFLAAHTKPL